MTRYGRTGKPRPITGRICRVDPIRDVKDVRNMKKLLADHPRNHCLFVMGINTNLRASDLLPITVGQVRGLRVGQSYQVREKKTGKLKRITMNPEVHTAVTALLETMPDASDGDPLFPSRKKGEAMCTDSLTRLVKGWCAELHLKGNFGSHTLRKTFGYMHRKIHKTDIPTLMVMFNHSSQRETLDYLGIQPEEVQDAYLKVI